MQALTPAALLTVWQEGEARHPIDRALLLLAAALPDWSWAELAAMPIGRCDGLLLQLRAATIGPRLDMLAACPACNELLEFGADTEEMTVVDALALPADPPPVATPAGDYPLRYIDSVALAEAARGSRHDARGGLAAAATDGDVSTEVVAAALASADPQADLLFTLDCRQCGHHWAADFDIGDFFWREISGLAKRLLDDVRELTAHYGWSEAEVMAMSPVRRRHYLERARP